MKISDALQGVSTIAFDTAPVIYFIERNPAYFNRMLEIMRYVDQGRVDGLGASILLTEVLVHPLRQNNTTLAQQYERVLLHSKNFRLAPITSSSAKRAAELRARFNLKTPDALHVAAAIDAGADVFLTNDLGIKRVQGIQVLLLDELEEPTST